MNENIARILIACVCQTTPVFSKSDHLVWPHHWFLNWRKSQGFIWKQFCHWWTLCSIVSKQLQARQMLYTVTFMQDEVLHISLYMCNTCYIQHLRRLALSVDPFYMHGLPDLLIWQLVTFGCIILEAICVSQKILKDANHQQVFTILQEMLLNAINRVSSHLTAVLLSDK